MAGQSLRIPLRSQCPAGKIRYYARAVAEEHRRSLERSDKVNRPTAGALATYWCRECSAWHVGHTRDVRI